MAIYTVQRRGQAAEPTANANTVFVKEGFSWAALCVPTFWAVANRLWVVLVFIYFAFAILLLFGGLLPGVAVLLLYGLGRLYLAVEANGLRRWTLARNGYELVGVVEGRGYEEAERRFFERSIASSQQQAAVSTADAVSPDVDRAVAPPPSIGTAT